MQKGARETVAQVLGTWGLTSEQRTMVATGHIYRRSRISHHIARHLSNRKHYSLSSDDSPAEMRFKAFSSAGRTERFRISEFTIHSSQGLVKALQMEIALEHIDCGVVHIRCKTSGDHKSLLKGCKPAH